MISITYKSISDELTSFLLLSLPHAPFSHVRSFPPDLSQEYFVGCHQNFQKGMFVVPTHSCLINLQNSVMKDVGYSFWQPCILLLILSYTLPLPFDWSCFLIHKSPLLE